MNDSRREHPDRSVLVAFGQGKLPPAEVSAVESHIADCPQCCETLQDLEGDTFVELVRRSGDLQLESAAQASEPISTTEAFSSASARLAAELPPELANHPRYQIIRLLGRGGMGVVFAAEHRLMNRLVALKVIKPSLINKPEAVARFRREVRAAAKLAHPNIVTAYDAEQAGEIHFLVMEYVEGIPLSQIVDADGPLAVAVACGYVRQVADALQHAHESAMVHRDVKPHNVMVDGLGRVKILDFGIAALVETSPGTTEESDGDGPSTPPAEWAHAGKQPGRLTELGMVMGTPDYVAPEQVVDPSSADVRSDIYSLGCTLYFLLTGRPPFPEGTAQEKLRAHAHETPSSLAALNRDVSPELEAIVTRMMAKEPSSRYPTPAEVAAALRPFAQTSSTREGGGRSWSRWIAGAAAAAMACFVAAVIYVKTDQGTLEIKTSEPAVQIVLSQNGRQVKVIDIRSGSSIERLPSGRYNVELHGARNLSWTVWSKPRGSREFRRSQDTTREGFTLSRGDHVLASVVRMPDTAVDSSVGMRTSPQQDAVNGSSRSGEAPTSRIQLEVHPTDATPITVQNSGFEDPPLPDGRFVADNIPHWTIEAADAGAAGVENVLDQDFTGATDGGSATTIPDGRNLAVCGGSPTEDGSTISQVLSAALTADTHYVLQAAVGRRGTGGWPKYRVQLCAGGEVLAEDDDSLTPALRQFLTATVNYVADADAAQLGQPLEVRLLAKGEPSQTGFAQVQFDHIQLFSRPSNLAVERPSISLAWSAIAGGEGYVVERGEGWRTGPFRAIAAAEPSATTFVDADPSLRPGTTYYYRILSRGARSIRSTPMGATTLTARIAEGE